MKPLPQVFALGTAQTVAWASSTYLPAILARPIAAELGISTASVFGAFSVSLVVMALAGPPVGRAIDRAGGRGMLAASNLVLAAGLVALGLAGNAAFLFAAWLVLGVGMAMGLYDAAFAALVWIHGPNARNPITGITLIAGFASTVGWPLTAFLAARYGWREACYAWAAINLLIALPLNLWCLPEKVDRVFEKKEVRTEGTKGQESKSDERRDFVLLSIFFAATAFVTSAFAAHLPGLLVAAGATAAVALTAGTLLGPAQVAARLTEFLAQKRWLFHPLVTARVATALHPAGALMLAILGGGPIAACAFAVVHGAGNGMVTIAKGTLPLAVFGPAGYGYRVGLMQLLARAMQALAPFAFAVVLGGFGARAALALSAGLSLVALGALLGLRASRGRAAATMANEKFRSADDGAAPGSADLQRPERAGRPAERVERHPGEDAER
jgi:MFS family permease